MMVLLFGFSAIMQRELNRERERLKLTRLQPLENAPPALAFTTIALGGFRGIIANVLWIRLQDLQLDEKYFEMVQLADWITKLQPHFSTVWVFQAWNLAYNISVKFPDDEDRWKWVSKGIELLRDEGLKYNPKDPKIYRELAWFFQHKLGGNLDNSHRYYKARWKQEMEHVFGGPRPDFGELIEPKTDDAISRVQLLREKYKIDPVFMREADEKYGPLEWRLPEAHAIYWAHVGLQKSKKDELIQLRRVIYQSLMLSALRGRIITYPDGAGFDFGPNLSSIPHANEAYLQMMKEDVDLKFNIETAHKNFLIQAIGDLYVNNQLKDAAKWFDYYKKRYPGHVDQYLNNRYIEIGVTNYTLTDFAMARYEELINETGKDRVQGVIEGMLRSHFTYEAIDEPDLAAGYYRRTREFYRRYERRFADYKKGRMDLPQWTNLYSAVLNSLLTNPPPVGFNESMTMRLCSALRIPYPKNVNKQPEMSSSLLSVPDVDTRDEAIRNIEEGEKFLANNRRLADVKSTTSGLQYRVKKSGSGRTPVPGDKVRVHYIGKLLNGSVFDNSYEKGGPIDFDLTGVVKGWQEVLQLMKEGDRWEVFIPSDLAYGALGSPPNIGPNATLTFEMELIKVLPQ